MSETETVSKLRLHNTLTRGVEFVLPGPGGRVRMYCCGPTVYGPAHIGNFRTFLLQDVLRRVLEAEFGAGNVVHVRNITDVDDKTIRQSQAEGKTLAEFTRFWTEKFHADCGRLNMLKPHHEPSATGHIAAQVAMVEKLLEKGHAYVGGDGSVYFKVTSFADYGRLSGLDRRELKTQAENSAGQANDADEYDRESVADFALWKAHKPEDGENRWDGPRHPDTGAPIVGRPGWHLECSAMSTEAFGDNTFEIHGGGVDLTFPHHENEIAQSVCACGGEFAKLWFHSAHLMVEGQKMSKSLGNLYTLEDLVAKGHDPMVVRYALLSGHYRQQLNFTENGLHAAEASLRRLNEYGAALRALADGGATADGYGAFRGAFYAIRDDLNLPKAFGEVFHVMKMRKPAGFSAVEVAESFAGLERIVNGLLGLDVPFAVVEAEKAEAPGDVRALAEERWQAKQAKDWGRADELRDALQALGWRVLDRKDGYDLEVSG